MGKVPLLDKQCVMYQCHKMSDSIPEQVERLLPEYHPQTDLFVCDVADAVIKDDMASMEHPFYSLSKKPDLRVRRYENGDNWLEVTPSVKGLATIYDKDILIYCISQIIGKIKQDVPAQRTMQITAKELLVFINRKVGGRQYELLLEALERLKGTTITTNILVDDVEYDETEGFGLIDNFKIKRSKRTGRITSLTVTLSNWVFKSIKDRQVLTLHKDYFRLRKPLERRIYEIARKHCGKQDQWKISIEKLKNKCGSRGSLKEFKRLVRELVKGNHLPDYNVLLEEENVIFQNREAWWENQPSGQNLTLDNETYHDARLVALGYDIYVLEQEWRNWWHQSGRPDLQSPDKAFIGFCRNRKLKDEAG